MKKNGLTHKGTGFKVPDNYFETLEDRILQKAAAVDYPSQPGFSVPENYFQTFEDRLFKKTERSRTQKVFKLFQTEAFYYIAGAAAVFVAIVTTVLPNDTTHNTLQSIDMVSLETYLNEMLVHSSSEVSHFIQEGDYGFDSSIHTDIDNEAVIDYLNENIEEPSLLFNDD